MTEAYDDYVLDEAETGSSVAASLSEPRREHGGATGATALLGTIDLTEIPAPVLLLDRRRPADEKVTRPPGVRGGGGSRYSTRRLIGLDGLRAIAVLSVVIFHLDFSLAPGGFLGVDIFFVISGFLITNLLATEILTSGRLRLGRFYLRRARRLLPTVFALMIVVTIAAHAVWRDQLATLKGGVVSSLAYVTNWWLISDHQSYFASTGRPTMFQHLWSLAIEEQFYLVWSAVVVVVAGVVLASRRSDDPARRLKLVVVVALVLAAASTILMAVYATRSDLPYGGSTSPVYFGSDTHSMGLFLGSAAGAWWALHRHGLTIAAARAKAQLVGATDVIGLVAVSVLIYQFGTINEFSPGLYRGGFLVFDGVALVAILCAVRKGSFFGRLLDMRPIRWVGQRSYSIYIWHWPVAVVTRPGLDVPGPVFLVNVGRLALILGLSALSYHFIELPLRSGQFAKWRSGRRTRHAQRGELIAVLTTLAAAIALALAANPVGASKPPPIARAAVPVSSPVTTAPPTYAVSALPSARPSPHHSTPAKSRPSHRAARPPAKPSVSAFGDSVLLGAGPTLRTRMHPCDVDAVEGRQAYDVLNDVVHDEQHGSLEPDVLIHVGNNGIISPDQLASTLHALSDRQRIVLMNDRVERDWQDPNNQTIRSVGRHFHNVVLVDWHAMSGGHSDWLYQDGLHLTADGAAGYTRIVLSALKS